MAGERIIVIDDEHEMEALANLILRRNGFEVLYASNGQQGIEIIRNESPDLILLDYMMPEMNGLEVLDQLNAEQFDIPVIIVTARGNENVAVQGFRRGIKDYLTKPFGPTELLTSVQRVLSDHLLLREQRRLIERLKTSQITSSIGMGKRIFVSYSRSDWESFVAPIVTHLTSSGFRVWVDQHLLEGGQDWMDEIGKALNECDYMVLCVSPSALLSRYVKMEYRYFLEENKPVIPLVCIDTRFPPELRGIQYVEYSELDKLIRIFKHLDNS